MNTNDDLEEMSVSPKRSSAVPWVFVLLLGAAAAVSVAKFLSGRAEMAKLEAARNELTQKLAKATEAATAAQKTADEKASAATALEQKVNELQGQLSTQSTKEDETDKVIASLRSQLDSKDGEVASESNRITVNLVDEILFKSGDANLSPRGKQVLGKVGEVLKTLDQQILIGGHTDKVPIHTKDFPSNWELSSARAVTVVHFLAETVGVDPHRLAAVGYAEFHPRSKKVSRNRRIEILLTPNIVGKDKGGLKAVQKDATGKESKKPPEPAKTKVAAKAKKK